MNQDTVPYNLETEQSILALLLSGLYSHIEIPDPRLFFNSANREIAEAIQSLIDEGCEVGITSVWAKLQSGNKRIDCTHEYLGSLSCALIDSGSYSSTLNLLKKTRQQRDLMELCERILSQAPFSDPSETLQFAMTELARMDRGKRYEELVLPGFESACSIVDENIPAPEFIIHGLLRKGQRMMVQTASKAGKSWLSIYRAVCIASGSPYLGESVTSGPVVFVNFELPKWHITIRIRKICNFLGIEVPKNLIIWNLRGKRFTDVTLLADLERQINKLPNKPIHIEIDPIYKLYKGREENKTEQMAEVLALIEDISERHDCSIAYNHHHSKGDKAKNNMLDRSSGAGVFARDADVIVDLLAHTEKNCFILSSVLRTEPTPDNFVIEWSFPIFKKREDLDPRKHKKTPSSGSKEISPNILIECLGTTWTKSTDVLNVATRDFGVGRSTFYDLRKKAIADGIIEIHPTTGFLRRPCPSSPSPMDLIPTGESKSVHP